MPDISGVLLVLLLGLALLWSFASRSTTKKNGWLRKQGRRWRALANSAVFAESHLEKLAASFAGDNGLLVRQATWGEFQTCAIMTREGPIWFPIGNLSHISTHAESDGIDDDGNEKKKLFGVVHMKNGCMYITDDTFDGNRQFVVDSRMSAFRNFSVVAKTGAVEG